MKYESATDVNSYLLAIPKDRKPILARVMKIIKDHIPKARLEFKHGMPFYTLNGQPMYAVASQKHYIAVYCSAHSLVSHYKSQLGKVNTGKSCIRFKKEDDINWDVLTEMLVEAEKEFS